VNKFIESYRSFKNIKAIFSSYRFCWIPFKDGSGNGIYSSIEFFDEEIAKLDNNKIQLIVT